jgi:hypothetical protein
MGTEHNTPEMIPLTCDTRGNKPLSPKMQKISYEGACIVAAHQYLRSKGGPGFYSKNGLNSVDDRNYYIRLGNAIIHFRHQKNNLA